MLDFMRALEVQAKRFYENKCFGHYEAIEQVRASNAIAITARLRPKYRHVKISIDCIGLRLRIIGDASPSKNDGFYCQFRLYPCERFRARHCATLSVLDLSGAGIREGWRDFRTPHFQLPHDMKIRQHGDDI